jgi:hypothetical protein
MGLSIGILTCLGIDAAVNCKEGLFDQAQMNLGFKVFEE